MFRKVNLLPPLYIECVPRACGEFWPVRVEIGRQSEMDAC